MIDPTEDLKPRDVYVVWSNEHRLWWNPNRSGYTNNLASAGHYCRDEAIAIARGRDGWTGIGVPAEIAVPLQDALDAIMPQPPGEAS